MESRPTRRHFLQLAGAVFATAFVLGEVQTALAGGGKRRNKYATSNLRTESERSLFARFLFGEFRQSNITDLERVAGGYAPINRMHDPDKRWGTTLRDVLLEPKQFSCFNPEDANYAKVFDPEAYEPSAFYHCLALTDEILSGRQKDPARANHYHEASLPRPKSWPSNVKLIGRLVVGKTRKGKPVYSAHKFYAG